VRALWVLCWPVALIALYRLVWLFLLPFRLVGIGVHGAFAIIRAAILFPARLLSTPFRI
jgi:hypothetical protein